MTLTRNSNIELFRIITMLMIIAHHYVVNSGLYHLMSENPLNFNSYFLYLFGMWGKTGINCFILITGYYMCQSQITGKKFIKLLFEICFYNAIIYLMFVLTGIIEYDFKICIIQIIPFKNIGSGFISAYILFYLFIPYLNTLINNINKKQHILIIALSLFIYTIWYMSPFDVKYNYISWFIVIYFIASFIRIYPYKIYKNFIFWKYMLCISIFISCFSVIYNLHNNILPYKLVSDSNAIMAVITSLSAFMYFVNLKIKQNKLINILAMSIFGVLLIHANSDTMRNWLWKDILHNIQYFNNTLLCLHALTSVIVVFVTCSFIDLLRIHFIEKPFFKSKLFLSIESNITNFLK